MIRIILISMFAMFSATAQAQTVGSYSKCKTAGDTGACTSCLKSGQFYNFDKAKKRWVCGATTDMKPSKTRPSTKPSVNKQKPSSSKKR